MSWRDLLKSQDAPRVTAPWVGGRTVQLGQRAWTIEGRLPSEHGWYIFNNQGRTLTTNDPAPPDLRALVTPHVRGYLVGDLLLPDDARVGRAWCALCRATPLTVRGNPVTVGSACPTCASSTVGGLRIQLVEAGLERFSRATAARPFAGDTAPWVYMEPAFHVGPEDAVLEAYQLHQAIKDDVPHVTPALRAAFAFECWLRDEAARRRAELDALRQAEEARRALEERRAALVTSMGDGTTRRELAKIDFAAGATKALAVSGARYLDHRVVGTRPPREFVVHFLFLDRRWECVVDEELRVIDAGICLSSGGVRGDAFFTLESLPAVIQEADDNDVLHVTRRV